MSVLLEVSRATSLDGPPGRRRLRCCVRIAALSCIAYVACGARVACLVRFACRAHRAVGREHALPWTVRVKRADTSRARRIHRTSAFTTWEIDSAKCTPPPSEVGEVHKIKVELSA